MAKKLALDLNKNINKPFTKTLNLKQIIQKT